MIKLNSGTLYAGDLVFNNVQVDSFEIEMSASEYPPINIKALSSPATFSYELCDVDLELLNELAAPAQKDIFTLEHFAPIMIQARWHKKPRLRKKYLKRYGMKPDVVKIHCDVSEFEYNTAYCTFDIDANSYKRILRPDQMRRGLKINF